MFGFRFLMFFFLVIGAAQAKDLCTLYRNNTPLPDWYNNLCTGDAAGFDGLKSVVGGSYSTFADAFSLNPASLPTVPLPLGVEMVLSAPTGPKIGVPRATFNAIKGFDGVGVGIGSDTDNSIYSNRANHGHGSSSTTNSPQAALPTLDFAGAMSLQRLISSRAYKSWMPKIGTLLRYNSDIKNWSPGLGLATNLGPFSLGMSAIFQQEANFYPTTTVLTQSIGIHIFNIQADYTLISNETSAYTTTVSLFGIAGNAGGVTINAAMRLDSSYVTTYHFGLQYAFSPHFAVAYLSNYIPGFQSLSTQVMF